MKKYTVKIKSVFSNIVWYWNKEGQTFEATKEFTESLFWGPGDVYVTEHGKIYINDVEIITE